MTSLASLDYDVVPWDTDVDGATLSPAQGKWYQVTGSTGLTATFDGANIADEKSAVVEKMAGGPAITIVVVAAGFTLNGAASPAATH